MNASVFSARPDRDADADLPSFLVDDSVVVMKFGSSILRGPADASAVASEIYREVRRGRRVVAVVSAFAGHTDRLLREARDLGLDHDNVLLPAYVAIGEEKSARLTAIACDRVGLSATALSIRELGIRAEGPAEHAEPVALKRAALLEALSHHQVVVAPGFAAIDARNRVVLLGRGGSDMTALFLASELGLGRVCLVKDVSGLYDREPGAGQPVNRFARASFEDARRLGGRLVQADTLDMARSRAVEIELRAPGEDEGTIIGEVSRAPVPYVTPRRLRVALAGCGVVGGGTLSRLWADPRYEIVGVLVRDPSRSRDAPGIAFDDLAPLLTADPAELLARKPAILLESLSEAQAGYGLTRLALSRGIDVASANKQAVSIDPAGLLALAAEHGARISWSAAVGGGAPMIETMRAARAAGPIAAFEAVLNGTVNFMLERLGKGAAFDVALAEARAAGFAEEDPSSDLEGLDSAAKVRLLAFEAFDQMPALDAIACDVLSDEHAAGAGMRQISRCRPSDSGLTAQVRLKTSGVDPLFRELEGERNALRIIGEDGTVWTCLGRGAGRWPTSESLLCDLTDLALARRATPANA